MHEIRERNKTEAIQKGDDSWVTNSNEMEQMALNHFSEIFKGLNLVNEEVDRLNDVNKGLNGVSNALNKAQITFLNKPFSRKEVKRALFSMGDWKSPGPDGVPAEFYKKNWKWIKEDLLSGVLSFLSTGHILKELSKTNIALIPKRENPNSFDHFPPISL